MTQVVIPAHVPAERVYDFDVFADSVRGGDVQRSHMALHANAPDIFYTPRTGGHWMVTRFDDVQTIMTSPERFSSVSVRWPPPMPFVRLSLPPQDMDPPDHGKYRLLLLRFLGPKEVKPLEPQIRALMSELIDQVLTRGQCEFKAEVAVPLPVKTFMRMMQWDLSRYAEFVRWANAMLGSGGMWARVKAYLHMQRYLKQQVRARQRRPGDDPVSVLLASEIDGERLSEQRVLEMANLLFLAGLDTVTNALTFITKHLAEHPEVQQQLRDHPEKIPNAVEEFLRRYAFVNTPRRVAQDTEVSGVKLRKGDVVVASFSAASNDERRTPDPERLDVDRERPVHLAFNTGPHSCAGAPLARLELRVFLEEWLARVPPFAIAPGYAPKARGGVVMALESLPLVW